MVGVAWVWQEGVTGVWFIEDSETERVWREWCNGVG